MAPVGNVPAASPTTYIESGTVASEISGASVAPTIEPVAKITAEFAPVSACAAARRTTLARARASSEISSATAPSIIGRSAQARPRNNSRENGQKGWTRAASLILGTMKVGAGSINRCKRFRAMRPCSGHLQALKYKNEIVRRHSHTLGKHKAGIFRELLQIVDIAHAPFGVVVTETFVESGIAAGGVFAAALERSIEKEPPTHP